jgi:DNA-binding transcriptional LysR family regulator
MSGMCNMVHMHEPRLDLNLLYAFDALMASRHVTAAAGRLGVTQPTLSHTLRRLRAACGDPLFVRTARGVEPTPYALALAEPVHRALETIRLGLEQGRAFDPATSTQRFRVLMTDIGESVFLPRLVARLQAIAPRVDIVVQQLPSDLYRETLASGAADLAIGQIRVAGREFHHQALFAEDHVCLTRVRHPRIGRRLTRADFEREAHVVVLPPNSTVNATEQALARAGVVRRVALQVPHYLVVAQILVDADYIATVPRRAARLMRGQAQLAQHRAPLELPLLHVGQTWHERAHHDAAQSWLRATIEGLFADRRP